MDPDEIRRQRELGWPDCHPEDFCHRCGSINPSWYTDRATWDLAVGTAAEERARQLEATLRDFLFPFHPCEAPPLIATRCPVEVGESLETGTTGPKEKL